MDADGNKKGFLRDRLPNFQKLLTFEVLVRKRLTLFRMWP